MTFRERMVARFTERFPSRPAPPRRPPVRHTHLVKLVVLDAEDVAALEAAERPRTRGDCLPGGVNGERPCPFVSCKHHLALKVSDVEGRLREVDDWDDGRETCALDVAQHGGETLEAVGELLGITRERTRQIEERAITKLGRVVANRRLG